MKSLFISTILFLSISVEVIGQVSSENLQPGNKPILDLNAFYNWPAVVGIPVKSKSQRYVFYNTRRNNRDKFALHVADLETNQEIVLPSAGNPQFSPDGNKLIFSRGLDSLAILTLGETKATYIEHVASFKTVDHGKGNWIAYQATDLSGDLVFLDLDQEPRKTVHHVVDYEVNAGDSSVIYETGPTGSAENGYSIHWFSIGENKDKVVWVGAKADNFIFDQSGARLAFRVIDSNSKSLNVYDRRSGAVVVLFNDSSFESGKNLSLDNLIRFSSDGLQLFFNLVQLNSPKINPAMAPVDIWRYNDANIQSAQLLNRDNAPTFEAVIRLKDHRLLQLQSEKEHTTIIDFPNVDDFVLIDSTQGHWEEEASWSIGAQSDNYIVFTETGDKRHIDVGNPIVSPDKKYIVGVEIGPLINLVAYEISTGRKLNISKMVQVPLYMDEGSMTQTQGLTFQGWLGHGHIMYLADRFDLWKVDVGAQAKAENITSGFGRAHQIKFSIAKGVFESSESVIMPGQRILLSAFDLTNKDAGYFLAGADKANIPVKLSMGPYQFRNMFNNGVPGRMDGAVRYLVERSSAESSPNFFWTVDFRQFRPISRVCPERNYNWLTSALVRFPTLAGVSDEAIVYKPQNFDPGKRYPVVMTYYEIRTNELNKYKTVFSERNDDISIPWLVSHGYVVVVPDIRFTSHEIGQCALDAILGARKYLTLIPWIDTSHIGLQGTSFGAIETNYLVTHSRCFAAAMSSSGAVDLISESGDVWYGGTVSKQNYYENRQGKMGVMLWEDPARYIRNSPVFYLDRVTTPVLIIANVADQNLSYKQGLSFYLGLRRLGKPCWMLQYGEASHGTGMSRSFIDLTQRTQQFFDFYLKGALAPKWMVDGVPAEDKGIDDGLELLPKGYRPGPSLLNPSERKRVDSLVNTEKQSNGFY